jgi:hypothetical protein
MQLVVKPNGDVRCVYAEDIDLHQLGPLSIRRGSAVEPANGKWTADLSPVNGPTLGPFTTRTEALAAEVEWLQANWLVPSA